MQVSLIINKFMINHNNLYFMINHFATRFKSLKYNWNVDLLQLIILMVEMVTKI
jgi:hypothetical protein